MQCQLLIELRKCLYDRPNNVMIEQLDGIHEALTYEGIEEPEYTSVIERSCKGSCYEPDEVIWLYYDDNGILRKMVNPAPEIDWFILRSLPEGHCLLNVELFDAQGEPIRYCRYTENYGWVSDGDCLEVVRKDCLTIRRDTYRNGITKSEFFHISDDNQFSEKIPPEPVQEQLTEGLGWYCTEKYRTMDWWCDPKNDDIHWNGCRVAEYTVMKCAEQYRDDIWAKMIHADRNWWTQIDDVLYPVGKPGTSYGSELPVDDIYKIVIESDYTGIWEAAFQDYKNLKEVVLPDSLKWIESMAFRGCSSLPGITIPEGVTEIGESAFEGVPHIIYHGPAQSGDNWGALSRN